MSGLSENWTFHKANFPRCWGDIITPEHHSFTLTYGYIYKKKTNLTPIKTQDTDRAENWKNLGFFFFWFFFLLPLRLEVFHVSEMINVKFQSFSFCVSDMTHNITNKMNFFFLIFLILEWVRIKRGSWTAEVEHKGGGLSGDVTDGRNSEFTSRRKEPFAFINTTPPTAQQFICQL